MAPPFLSFAAWFLGSLKTHIYTDSTFLLRKTLLALNYLSAYMTSIAFILVGLMTKTVSVVSLYVLIAAVAAYVMMTLIKVVNPSHPPFRVILQFRQVRVRLGLPIAVNNIKKCALFLITEGRANLNIPRPGMG